MADQHNPNIPALGNEIASDIPDIKENLEFHKDVFQNLGTGWSDSDATALYLNLVTADITHKTQAVSPYTLTTEDLKGNWFGNFGAGAEVVFTWPALTDNQIAGFIVSAAFDLTITAPAAKTFRYLAATGAAQGTLKSSTIGNLVICKSVSDLNNILVTTIQGSWTYSE